MGQAGGGRLSFAVPRQATSNAQGLNEIPSQYRKVMSQGKWRCLVKLMFQEKQPVPGLQRQGEPTPDGP